MPVGCRSGLASVSVATALGESWAEMGEAEIGEALATVTAIMLFVWSIWAIVDWVVITIHMLQKAKTIDSVGFRAQFPTEELDTAFWISVVMLAIPVILTFSTMLRAREDCQG